MLLNTVDEGVLAETLSRPGPVAAPGDPFRVVYHGTLTPHYGVNVLVDAAVLALNDIPNLVVDVYGEGDSRQELEDRVLAYGLSEHIRFHDILPQSEVLAAVMGADAGVIPNHLIRLNRFALSTKLFEYVALGSSSPARTYRQFDCISVPTRSSTSNPGTHEHWQTRCWISLAIPRPLASVPQRPVGATRNTGGSSKPSATALCFDPSPRTSGSGGGLSSELKVMPW